MAPGGQDSFLSFASVLPSLRFREQQILFLDWIEKGACLHGQTHSLHAFSEQSCEGRAGGLSGGGKPEWGEEGSAGWARAPEAAAGGEVPGVSPF